MFTAGEAMTMATLLSEAQRRRMPNEFQERISNLGVYLSELDEKPSVSRNRRYLTVLKAAFFLGQQSITLPPAASETPERADFQPPV